MMDKRSRKVTAVVSIEDIASLSNVGDIVLYKPFVNRVIDKDLGQGRASHFDDLFAALFPMRMALSDIATNEY